MRQSTGLIRFSRAVFFPSLPRIIRARLAISVSFFVQGFIFATWCSRIPDIQVRFGLNEGQMGLLLFFIPLGQLIMMIPNGLLVKRFGSRTMLILAGFVIPSALLIEGVVTTLPLLGGALMISGAAANLSYAASNTQAVQLEKRYHRSIISLFHGAWSIACLVAVGIAMVVKSLGGTLQQHFWSIGAIGIALILVAGGNLLAVDHVPTRLPTEKTTKTWQFTPAIFWIGLAALGGMACEGTVYDWSGIYLKDTLGVGVAQVNYGYFAYLCTMVTFRLLGDSCVNRWGIKKMLLFCGSSICMGLALVIGSSWLTLPLSLALTVVGFAIVGCGTSAVVPLCCSLAGRQKTLAPSIAITEISTIGFVGFLIAPPIIGCVAKSLSLRVSFGLMMIVGSFVLWAVYALRQQLK